MAPIAAELVYSYVGHGARVLVQRALGEDAEDETVEKGHRFFLDFYQKHAADNTFVYPDMITVLGRLATKHKLAVLTNKPYKTSDSLMKALGLASYFFRVYGGDSFATKKPDPAGLIALMEEAKSSAVDTLMVGDSRVDVQTARNAGVRSYGVLWGFQPNDLRRSMPDMLMERPIEILDHTN